MKLGFRVVRTGSTISPYALERFDEKGGVKATRPASREEWTMYCLVMRQLP